ncbi:hypothetical protein [Brevundimonas sp. GN22]
MIGTILFVVALAAVGVLIYRVSRKPKDGSTRPSRPTYPREED